MQQYKQKIESALAKAKKDKREEAEIDALSIHLAEIEEVLDKKTKPAYSKNIVVLNLCRGKRFNSSTGKEESKVYRQTFTYSEAMLFSQNYKKLGFSVVEVVHNPFDNLKF